MSSITDPADAYLQRIGWRGAPPQQADLPTLDALIAGHAQAIPFENLSPLLGDTVDITPAAVQRKLVDEGRGGYCFEHNRLLADQLRGFGYPVRELAARVVWNQPPGSITPRSHMLLEVDTEAGPRLVDVGFGGLTLTCALQMEADVEQPTPHEIFRLLRQGSDWLLQVHLGDEWKPIYRFDRNPHYPCDYLAANHYLATHPDSQFVQRLMVARAGADCRWTLLNRDFAVHRQGQTRREQLPHVEALLDLLEGTFGIPAGLRGRLQPRLQGLFSA